MRESPVLRPMTPADLDELLVVQREGAQAGLAGIFPQERFPFPVERVRQRWERELSDPGIDCFVVLDDEGSIAGFAALRGDEFLHFGTAVRCWGSGLAGRAHDEVLAHWTARGLRRARLRVFEDNLRARRFYERRGWAATGERGRSTFPPYPVLLTYALELVRTPSMGATPTGTLTTTSIDGRWWAVATAGDAVRVWPVDDAPESGVLLRTGSYGGLAAAVVAGGGDGPVVVGLEPTDTMWRWRLSGELLGSDDPLELLWWDGAQYGAAVAGVDHPEVSVVVTAVGDRCLRAWDPSTGAQVGKAWKGHQERIMAVAAAALADGTPLVLSGGLDGVVRRWDARTGATFGPRVRSWEGDPMELATARLPDGRTAVCVATTDGALHRFDAASGQPLGAPVTHGRDDHDLTRLACLPTDDGVIMLTTADDQTVDVRDAVDGRVLTHVDTRGGIVAMAAAALDDGTPVVLAADHRGYLRRFHALAGHPLGAATAPFPRPVYHVWPVPDPARGPVLAAMLAGGLCRFDATSGDLIDDPTDPLPVFGSRLSVATVPDRGPLVVTTDRTGIYRVDLTTGTRYDPGPVDEDWDGWYDVTAVTLPDGRVIIAAGRDDGKVYRWDAVTGEPLPPLTGHPTIVKAVATATAADGAPMIVSVSEAGDVRRWDAATGDPIGTPIRAAGFDNGDLLVVRHDDGRQVLLCASRLSGDVYHWDPVTGRPTGPAFTVGSWVELLSAYVDPAGVPVAVLAILDGNYDTVRVERWRLDTAHKIDELPRTTRAVVADDLVVANDDGSLTVARLPAG